jgi:hypothetical protein
VFVERAVFVWRFWDSYVDGDAVCAGGVHGFVSGAVGIVFGIRRGVDEVGFYFVGICQLRCWLCLSVVFGVFVCWVFSWIALEMAMRVDDTLLSGDLVGLGLVGLDRVVMVELFHEKKG